MMLTTHTLLVRESSSTYPLCLLGTLGDTLFFNLYLPLDTKHPTGDTLRIYDSNAINENSDYEHYAVYECL